MMTSHGRHDPRPEIALETANRWLDLAKADLWIDRHTLRVTTNEIANRFSKQAIAQALVETLMSQRSRDEESLAEEKDPDQPA